MQLPQAEEEQTEDGETPVYLFIPYLPGFSEKYTRIARKFGVTTRHSKAFNLRNLLSKPKAPLRDSRKRGVVYRIPCETCGKSYIGETCRNMHQRINEHCAAIRSNAQKTRDLNAMDRHVDTEFASTGIVHVPNAADTSVIGNASDNRLWKTLEAFFVAANQDKVVAGNEAYTISDTYCHCLDFFRTLD